MTETARQLMSRPRQRYLWTDAFAVVNHLDLGEVEQALLLVDEVHRALGYLNGSHPTLGGLRIGKKLPERGPDEPYDERLEWDRDGQYFHYLIRWIHALNRVSLATNELRYNLWARELGQTAYGAFVRGDRMVWKMSVDLSRPLVSSMGQHDPLDGFVTFVELRSTAEARGWLKEGPCLEEAARHLEKISRGMEWSTTDPLGLGCLLMDSMRIEGAVRAEMQEAALRGLRARDHREREALAFREIGLGIGIRVARLHRYLELADEIEKFWLEPWNRTPLWNEHRDINEVMLATLLLKGGGVPSLRTEG